jgi:hypothetical protein
MPEVTSPEQLFEHELQDMYYAEQTLTKVLPKLADEATDRELSRAFTTHLGETRKQVTNLERVFEQLGKSPQAHPCAGIEGIKKEHDDFMKENEPSPHLLDAFLTGAASRAELRDRRIHRSRQSGPCAQAARSGGAPAGEPQAREGSAEEGRVDLEAPRQGGVERLEQDSFVDVAGNRASIGRETESADGGGMLPSALP